MMLLLLALALQGDASELAARALREEDKDKRQAIVAQLRKLDFAAVEKALRAPARGPSKIEPGKVVERQAKSDLDGEAFKYAVHLPEGYDPAKPWPLLVTLHGANMSGDPNAGTGWIQVWLRCAAASQKYVIVSPTTTRHTWSARQGHFYVLTALREMTDELSIDQDRVFIDGMSMGAGGAFRLAEHHPDRWAAIGPRCNVPDIRQKKDKTFVTMLAENFHGVPVYWVVGGKDEKISIEMVHAGKTDLEAAKGELVYREFPNGGHDWSLEKDDAVLEWYDKHVRESYPEEIVWKSYEKVFARAWWVEVTKRTEPPPLIMVHLDMKGQESERRTELRPAAVVKAKRKANAIEITTEEVRELRVWLDDSMVDLDKPVTITVNGRKAHDGVLKRSVDTLIDEARRRHDTSMTFSAYVDLKIK
jgi:enterochelin esterase-like enzyme